MTTPSTQELSLQVLVVDDERLARERIRGLLNTQSAVDSIETAATPESAVEAIRAYEPDLVFLDVQMPSATGLDVIRTVGVDEMPPTVFVTAHDEYAVEAFELAAVDYLLKPFDDERFGQALERALKNVERRRLGGMATDLARLMQHVTTATEADDTATEADYLRRIAVQTQGQVQIVPVDKIEFITAEGVYAELHTPENKHLIREKLSALEEQLDPRLFFRIHRSTIVRLDEVEMIFKRGGGRYLVRLRSGKKLRVSRGRIDALEQRLQTGA